jgi:hypothetical protein
MPAFQPISLADFRFSRAPDQDRFLIVAGMQAESVTNALSLRLAVATGQRNVDDGRGHQLALAVGLRLSVLNALVVKNAREVCNRLGVDGGRHGFPRM